ncbi:MAG: hypothetical protein ACU84Q_01575 [Gammaproteobacteria bacterium]
MTNNSRANQALATIHHAYFLGLQLMMTTTHGAKITGDWTFRLFRRQHEQYFLKSFTKLGLNELPHAIACAKYHVLSNSIGGVGVEYAEESSTKAWVRFRYPRWMFAGPTICGVTQESSRGFLEGWYAQNGVSLNNPKLGFVCVSEDMTGEFGFCGYFKEFDHVLDAQDRLKFARGELPPPFDPAIQPALPADGWDAARLAQANRNYSVAYVKNGIQTLIEVLGRDEASTLGCRAARLIGLQYFPETAALLDAVDGDYRDSAKFLLAAFSAMGDIAELEFDSDSKCAVLTHRPASILKGVGDESRRVMLDCWLELWIGAIRSHRMMKSVEVQHQHDSVVWTIADRVN